MKKHSASGEYWIPGVRAIEVLVREQPDRIIGIWYAGAPAGRRDALLDEARKHAIEVHEGKMKSLNERFTGVQHQGICARVKPVDYTDWQSLVDTDNGLLIAVDQVTDPRNFGAILRSAECLGAHGALTTKNRAARLGPIVAKTSAGASELLPVAIESNLARALRHAKASGYQVIGADFDGVSPDLLDMRGPTVLVIGAEGQGLRRLTRELCDGIATIPQTGVVQSLNAASAASILIYEAARQRQKEI